MSLETQIIIALAIAVVILFLLWRRAQRRVSELAFAKSSLSSKYGKMTEQFMPFLKDYPYDAQNFRFLGTPVDGVQFNPDGVVFIEFKTASASLSRTQQTVRDQVKNKRVSFEEIRIE